VRPRLTFLSEDGLGTIIDQARITLHERGVEVHHPVAVDALASCGAIVDRAARRVRIPATLLDRAIDSAPRGFSLFDLRGEQTHDFGGVRTHFAPGSAALLVADAATGESRRAVTRDYVAYARLVSRLEHLPAQSTAMIPADVPDAIADSYRLYLSLITCEKPVVTGAFSGAGFELMRDLLAIARGDTNALAERPLAMFSCCPTSPLKWGEAAASNLVDCARHGIPVEIVPMPLAGMTAAVTPFGALAQHAAEALSGVTIAQTINPGTPVMFGSSIGILDVRTTTTPLGAAESMRLGCLSSAIGHRLGLPTQAYMVLSDAKLVDAQSGLESAMGAALAALSGINSVSGPGMHDFQTCFSLEKLVVDHQICGMALRLVQEVAPAGDVPVEPLLAELSAEKHLVIAAHTRQHLREAISFPSATIDRHARARWEDTGRTPLIERVRGEIRHHLDAWEPVRLPAETLRALESRMAAAARAAGLDRLPDL
jgi:trimethylamine:corrinoid methyltransferase-like protein